MKEKAVHRLMAVWRLDDGTDAEMTSIEHQMILQRQWHAMANSDDPILREAGERRLSEVAEAAAAKQFADLQNAASAKKPRPNAKNPFRSAVIEAMSVGKRNDQDFKTFMQMWQLGHIHGLTIKAEIGDSYIIADENGDLGSQSYKWRTLEKMYSQRD